MNKFKASLGSIAIFILGVVMAYFFDEYYRSLIRWFFSAFSDGRIKFVGKNFHLFAGYAFVIAFGLFCSLYTFLFYKKRKQISFVLLSLLLFFTSSSITSLIDIKGRIKTGNITINYNGINYELHFIIALFIAIIPLFLAKANKK